MRRKNIKIKSFMVLTAVISAIVIVIGVFLTRCTEKKAVIGDEGGLFSINGYAYDYCSNLQNYKISNKLIGKTKDGMKIYMIEEYPDYEYVAGYYVWDGQIYKRMN